MTVKLCIFGNSHVGALREAWIRNPGRWPGLSLGFLAAQKDHLLQTGVQDGQLVATNPESRLAFERINGRSGIALADYDGFVVAGAAICVNAILPVYRDSRWIGLPSVAANPVADRIAETLISCAAANAVMRAGLQERLGHVFAQRLRQHSNLPIFLASQPRVSQEILTAPRPALRLHNNAIRNGDAETLGHGFDQIATDLLGGLSCTFLPQPAQSCTHGILTRLEYVTGARRLTAAMDAPQPKSDVLHANGAYGALVIDQIVAAL